MDQFTTDDFCIILNNSYILKVISNHDSFVSSFSTKFNEIFSLLFYIMHNPNILFVIFIISPTIETSPPVMLRQPGLGSDLIFN